MKAEIDMYSKEVMDCLKTKKLKHNLKGKKKVNGISVFLRRAFTAQVLNWYFCACTIIQVKRKRKKPVYAKTFFFPLQSILLCYLVSVVLSKMLRAAFMHYPTI